MTAYRLGLLLSDIGWNDITKLMQDKRTLDLSSQLCRSIGSIGANIAEGYFRGSHKDRARFYEYALGSARECRGWYYNSQHILSKPAISHRIGLLTELIRLLLTMVPQQRGYSLHDDKGGYSNEIYSEESIELTLSKILDQEIPFP